MLWVVGFEEHLELYAVGVLERQHRAIFALGDRRVTHAELLEPCQPLVEAGPGVNFECHVVKAGTPGIEGFALVPVVLLELDDGPRWRMLEQNSVPPVAADPLDFGELEQRSPPWALTSASRTENEMCDTLLKVVIEIPRNSRLDAARVFRREYVGCLSHHPPDDLGGRFDAPNCPHPFAGRVDH